MIILLYKQAWSSKPICQLNAELVNASDYAELHKLGYSWLIIPRIQLQAG